MVASVVLEVAIMHASSSLISVQLWHKVAARNALALALDSKIPVFGLLLPRDAALFPKFVLSEQHVHQCAAFLDGCTAQL